MNLYVMYTHVTSETRSSISKAQAAKARLDGHYFSPESSKNNYYHSQTNEHIGKNKYVVSATV